jgi:hypothetical protein
MTWTHKKNRKPYKNAMTKPHKFEENPNKSGSLHILNFF